MSISLHANENTPIYYVDEKRISNETFTRVSSEACTVLDHSVL